jgi:FMN-dependent NADH-azoreductase
MAKLIYIESSPRKSRSHSINVSKAFLETYAKKNPNDSVEKIDLWSEVLPTFSNDVLNAKYSIMHGSDPSADEKIAWGEIESLFRQFNSADKYLFSVPMWNFGLPYVLKHYIDVITQPGLAWSFTPETSYTGLVEGKVAVIYATGGEYTVGSQTEAFDLQKPAFENWLGFIGLTNISPITIAPTLSDPSAVEKIVGLCVEEAEKLANTF